MSTWNMLERFVLKKASLGYPRQSPSVLQLRICFRVGTVGNSFGGYPYRSQGTALALPPFTQLCTTATYIHSSSYRRPLLFL